MANTYSKIYLQFVFAVKNRSSLIEKHWKDDLYKYITGIVQKNNHKLIAINGVANHIHIFIGYKVHQSVPDLMQDVKGSSSLWINKNKLSKGRFSWQEGYGSFSYGESDIPKVARYIENQEAHHSKNSFKDEYVEFLEEFNIEYDVRYIFDDIK